MKFLGICKNVLEHKKLQRVRIKVDPMWAEKLGLHNSPNFEGYVIEENAPDIKVFIVNVPPGFDPVQTVSKNNIEQIEQPPQEVVPQGNYSKLTLLKKAILDKLMELARYGKSPMSST
jgi:hypothetical protein